MVDSRLRRVVNDPPFELNEAPEVSERIFIKRLRNRRYLCLDFSLDASIRVVNNDKIGDQAQGDNFYFFFPGRENLWNGAHAHNICTGGAEESALSGRLEGRTGDPGVSPLSEIIEAVPEIMHGMEERPT